MSTGAGGEGTAPWRRTRSKQNAGTIHSYRFRNCKKPDPRQAQMASASDVGATQRRHRSRAPAGLGPVVGPVLGFGLAVGRIAGCGAAASARRGSNTTLRRSFCEMPGRAAEAQKKSAEILRGSRPSLTFLSPGGRMSETRSASDQQRLHGCRRRGCSQCLAATPVRSHGAERRCQRRYCPLFFQRLFHQRLRRVSSPHDPAIGSASVR